MRINAYVAAASKLSRRSADDAIAAGRVMANGTPATLGQQVEPSDSIELDGKRLSLPTDFVYICYHKPVGLVVSRQAQSGNQTIYQHLPTHLHSLQPIGRLDKDSSGLLLLTNDGQFAHRAAHPSFGKLKTYEVSLDRPITPPDLLRLGASIELEDGPSNITASLKPNNLLTVQLEEGRNRQIRRTFEALGYTVRTLHRTKFGSLSLDNLAPGSWRSFAPEELK